MPTLNWIGKEAVVNHHLQVPFHLLKDVPELACGAPGNGNLIVQGDNRFDSADSEEKRAVGAVWASRSGGSCLFAMPTDRDFVAIISLVKR